MGASGSGKSTLMNILAALDRPTAGSVRVAGHDLAAMNARQRLAYRRRVVGFIWQQTARNLLPYLTAAGRTWDLPMRLAGLRCVAISFTVSRSRAARGPARPVRVRQDYAAQHRSAASTAPIPAASRWPAAT